MPHAQTYRRGLGRARSKAEPSRASPRDMSHTPVSTEQSRKHRAAGPRRSWADLQPPVFPGRPFSAQTQRHWAQLPLGLLEQSPQAWPHRERSPLSHRTKHLPPQRCRQLASSVMCPAVWPGETGATKQGRAKQGGPGAGQRPSSCSQVCYAWLALQANSLSPERLLQSGGIFLGVAASFANAA